MVESITRFNTSHMKRFLTHGLSLLLVFSIGVSPVLAATKDGFSEGVSARELREKYDDGTIRILLVAGHEPGYGGAVYQGVYEREIVSEITTELESLLSSNEKYEVIVSRDGEAWDRELAKFFRKEEKNVKKFIKAQRKKLAKLLRSEESEIVEHTDANQVHHATAPEDVALRLYSINQWANKNKVDVVVHMHVNDAPDHGPNTPSKYTGFAVYVPDKVFGNSDTSTELGEDIADRLLALGEYSTLPGEGGGVVHDRELIAVGANATLYPPSVLIEYGYISEPRFTLPEYRQTVTKDAAYQTYLALQDFFGDEVENPRSVTKLPALWPAPVAAAPVVVPTSVSVPTPVALSTCAAFTGIILPAKNEKDIDTTGVVKRLQTILAKDKTIYPEGLVTGYFGPATKKAVQALQKKHDIISSGTPETTGYGAVGPKTAKVLMSMCEVG